VPRSNAPGNSADPDTGSGHNGWRSFGDGLVGRIVAARLQGFSAIDGDYRDVAVDSTGQLLGVGGGSGGGLGVVTVADGADVAQGSTTDLSSFNTVIGLLKAVKALLTGTLSVGTHAVTDGGGSLTVDGSIAVSNLPATQAVSAAALPLPAGASTETTLAAVSTATGALADAESGAGNGSVIALLKRARTLLGDISSDLGVPSDVEATANGSLIAVLKRVRTLLSGGLPAALGASGGLKVEQVVAGPTQPVSGTLAVSNFPATQPVSAAALPLPAGASTEATVSALNAATGAQADAEQAGNGSVIAILKRLRTLLAGGLPAALVGGRLDVNIGASPVTIVTDTKRGGTGSWTWVSLQSAAPAIGAVQADTGALPAGDYELHIHLASSDTVAVGKGLIVEHRNAANGATLRQFGGIGAADAIDIDVPRVTLALNERIRVIAGTAAGAAASFYVSTIGRRLL
jgi:hypothetical protein